MLKGEGEYLFPFFPLLLPIAASLYNAGMGEGRGGSLNQVEKGYLVTALLLLGCADHDWETTPF